MTDIVLLILTSLSIIGLIFVIYLFLKLSQKFELLRSDLFTTLKDKDQVSVLSQKSEEDLQSVRENIVVFTKQLQDYLNNTIGKIREDVKRTSDLLESLNSIVNQKDLDLDRYKKGYDLVRLRSFVINVIEAVSFLQNRKSEFTDQKFKSYVDAYEKQLLRILNDLSIKAFAPKIGDRVTDLEGIEVIGSSPTSEPNQSNCVSEILSDGFIMNFQDGRKEILKTAQVNVYK